MTAVPLHVAVALTHACRDAGEVQAVLRLAAAKHLAAPVALYRLRNPRSRAVDHTTLYGSGAHVRRRTCIYCRRVVATSCAGWRETKRSERAVAEHAPVCSRAYLAGLAGDG